MAAIVTNNLRTHQSDLLLTEIIANADSDRYYIGIGKSDVYSSTDATITPTQSDQNERDVRHNLQSIKKVEASSMVIPRYNWSSGSVYSAWSDASVGIPTNSYYVITDINEIFIAIKQAKNASGVAQTSTVKPEVPAGASRTEPFELSDGYVWKFMYGLSAGKANSFLSAGFVPVEKIGTASNAFETDQKAVQDSAIGGQIIGVELDSAGAGYGSAPTITFRGNGASAAATATLSGGQVVKVEMNNESAGLGSGYDFASVLFSGGSPSKPAKARAVIGPKAGLGADPRNDLKANSVMLNIKPDGTVSDTFITGNSFRQISLFKGMRQSDSSVVGGIFTGTSSLALRSMKSANASNLTIGRIISDGSSPPKKAFIDDISGTSIFYHQNDSTGFGVFDSGATISDGIQSISVDSANISAAVNSYTGDLFYIDQRAKILRADAQQEDIKVILTV
jgi:hypothetical protein